MALGVMALDVLELRRLSERRHIPIQVPHPLVQRRVSRTNVANVALEVLHIHRVEADDRRVQSDIGFRDVRAVVVWSFGRGKVRLRAVEGFEELGNGGLVGILGRGEAGAVHAVVDVRVGPLVGGFDVLAEIGGEEVDLAVLLG